MNRKENNTVLHALLVLFSCTLLLGCAGKTATDKQVFTFNFDQPVTSLDPAFVRTQNNVWCVNQLFNSLLQLNDSLVSKPCLAKSWEISEDGLVYTFHLRTDVFFHDHPVFTNGKGRKMVAADVAYSFGRIIDPETASSGAWVFNDKIAGKQAFKAFNDSTLVITLTKPFPAFLGLLSTQYCSVVPKEIVQHYGKDFRNHPVGTGPFVFKYWKEGEVMVFVKNEHYFERESSVQLPYLDAVKMTFISDKQTAFLEFLKKKLDFFSGIDGSYRNDILTKTGQLQPKYQGRFHLSVDPYLNTEYLGILVDTNLAIVKNSPLKYKKMRQAISYAIDREKMIRYLQNGVGVPGNQGFLPEGMPSYDTTKIRGYKYNPEKARQLVREAGFSASNPVPTITLNTVTTYRDLIEFVQSELNAVGIPTKVELQQGASLREMVAKNNLNFFRGSWIADYPDAENYLAVFYSKNFVPAGPNYTHFYSKKFDELFERSFYERNDSVRYGLYQQMDNLVMEEAPVVILFYDQQVKLHQNSIVGLSNNPINLLSLKRVRKLHE